MKLLAFFGAMVGVTLAWALGVIFLFVIASLAVVGALLIILLLIYVDVSTSDWGQAIWKLIPLALAIFLIAFIIDTFNHANF